MSTPLQRVVDPRESSTPDSGGQSGSGSVQRTDAFDFVPLSQRHLGPSIKKFKKEQAV